MYGLFLIVNVNMKTKDISLLTCKKRYFWWGILEKSMLTTQNLLIKSEKYLKKKMHYDCTNFQVKSSQSRAATKLAREGYAQY